MNPVRPPARVFLVVSLCVALLAGLWPALPAGAAPAPPAAPAAPDAAAWSAAGSLATARVLHSTTLLSDGRVLVVGGKNGSANYLATAELYDPTTGVWSATGSLATARYSHTATLLPDGRVLVAGGCHTNNLASAELYDPATGLWTATGNLATARADHTATLLTDGRVLVVGGAGASAAAEIYNPATGAWSAAGNLSTPRVFHTATLLRNGRVLVTGGRSVLSASYLASAEVYNPTTGAWSMTGSIAAARGLHSATLLPDGRVLIAGGFDGSTVFAGAELYDPANGTWRATGTNLTTPRRDHAAALLPDGRVLVASGIDGSGYLASAEVFDPAPNGGLGAWSGTAGPTYGRSNATGTVLRDGRVLVVGGQGVSGYPTAVEAYRPATGGWSAAAPMATKRRKPTATPLLDGRVLVTGGDSTTESVEVYDPAPNGGAGAWSATGSLATGRYNHTATLLPDGRVLVVGGRGLEVLASAELYDPTANGGAGAWSAAGSLAAARYRHTATLLPDGRVLVVGGITVSGSLSSAELYDPTANGGAGAWSATGSLAAARGLHTATLLPDGRVLVVGGYSAGVYLASAELFDPAANGGAGAWSATGSLTTARGYHTATLLPDGRVLVAGGEVSADARIASAEVYNPQAGTWSAAGSLTVARKYHTATLLGDGRVLVAGGLSDGSPPTTSSVDVYDPTANSGAGAWSATGNLAGVRQEHTATLLPDGRVLVAGGWGGQDGNLASAELYDPGLGYQADWQPALDTVTAPLLLGAALTATGARFRGVSEASGGGLNNSASDHPLVQLRRLDNEQTRWLPVARFDAASLTTTALGDFPPGPALVTVFVNGIPGVSKIITVTGDKWNRTGSLAAGRAYHTATLLADGRVLVVGGQTAGGAYLATAELYDAAANGGAGAWTATAGLSAPRSGHTATLLPDGRVLVVGGSDAGGYPWSAEIYDPAAAGGAGAWSLVGNVQRIGHAATLLSDGRVAYTGGFHPSGIYPSGAFLFNPASGEWLTLEDATASGRRDHTATLLPDGRLLVVGGSNGSGWLTSAVVCQAVGYGWRATGNLAAARSAHTATLLPDGRVLVAGGYHSDPFVAMTSAEVWDATGASGNGSWRATGGLAAARAYHTAALLPDGRVLVAGGMGSGGSYLASAELYDAAANGGAGAWRATSPMTARRTGHTATLLADGRVLVAGGFNGTDYLATAEVYDHAPSGGGGSWTATAALATARVGHTATLLPDGRVLFAGGGANANASAELFDPTGNGAWLPTGSLATNRAFHTATLLGDGRVLVAGGGDSLASAELYDPATGAWTPTGSLATGRAWHTATLLGDGRVLVTGGKTAGGAFLATAEIYDPATGAWRATGSLSGSRARHTATLLTDGRVLVAGGGTSGAYLATAEIYDPAAAAGAGAWTPTGSLAALRLNHTATLLADGRVLVTGGQTVGNALLTTAEIYDPAAGAWRAAGAIPTGRIYHTATLLADGRVVVMGGVLVGVDENPKDVELYDPAANGGAGAWRTLSPIATPRSSHTATLLPDGRVLVAGGQDVRTSLLSAQRFDLATYLPAWRPVANTVTPVLLLGNPGAVTGDQFRGVSEASSGGTNSSATDHPSAQLRRLDNGQTRWLPVTHFDDTSITLAPLGSFTPGPARLTIFVNGIAGNSLPVTVALPRVTVSRDAANLRLQWPFAGGIAYDVWRGTTPDFAPPGAGEQLDPGICQVADGAAACTDANVVGVENPAYFYVVRFQAAGDRFWSANRTGVFSFALTAGSH